MLWNVDVPHKVNRLQKDMNALFSNYGGSNNCCTFPLINADDTNDSIIVTAELPGMTKDKISITYTDGNLTISGKSGPVIEDKKATAIRQERSVGKFDKSIRIPSRIEASKISATFTDGIVSIVLPKSEEAKPRTINVETR